MSISRDEILNKHNISVDVEGNYTYSGRTRDKNEIDNGTVCDAIDIVKETPRAILSAPMAASVAKLINLLLDEKLTPRPDQTVYHNLCRLRDLRRSMIRRSRLVEFNDTMFDMSTIFEFSASDRAASQCVATLSTELKKCHVHIASLESTIDDLNKSFCESKMQTDEVVKTIEVTIIKLNDQLTVVRRERARLYDMVRKVRERRELRLKKPSIRSLRKSAELKQLKKTNDQVLKEVEFCRITIRDQQNALKRFKNQLRDRDNLLCELNDAVAELSSESRNTLKNGKYSSSVRKVIWKLKQCKVSDSAISEIFKTFSEFFQISVPQTPSRRTVARTVIAGSRLCSEQTKEILCKTKHIAFGSDETTKDGQKLLMNTFSYADLDSEGQFVRKEIILSLDSIPDKSAETQLACLLSSLNALEHDPSSKKKVAEIFFEKVVGTISDSAATQKKLNRLVQNLRDERLKTLSGDERLMCVDMCNSFCQIHAINNLVAPILESFSEVERKGNSKSNRASLVSRIANDGSKLFGQRAASVNDKMDFVAFVNANDNSGLRKKISPTIPSFLGHRFMICCVINDVLLVYKDFLNNFISTLGNGSEQLLEFYSIMNSEMGSAQMFVLCALFQKILRPLWNNILRAKHILETREYVTNALHYIKLCSTDPNKIFDNSAAEKFGEDWFILDSLPNAWTNLTPSIHKLCYELWNSAISSIEEYLVRYYAPYLVGKYSDILPNDEKVMAWSAVPTHNVGIESRFAFVDYMFKIAPRMRVARRGIQAQMTLNRTIEWLEGKSNEEQNDIIDGAIRNVPKMEHDIKVEEKLLESKRLLKRKEKNSRQEALENKKFRKMAELTADTFGEGFWVTPADIDEFREKTEDDLEFYESVKRQIKYRTDVLAQAKIPRFPDVHVVNGKDGNELVTNLSLLMKESQYAGLVPMPHAWTGRLIKHVFEENGAKVIYKGEINQVLRTTGRKKKSTFALITHEPWDENDDRPRIPRLYSYDSIQQELVSGDLEILDDLELEAVQGKRSRKA